MRRLTIVLVAALASAVPVVAAPPATAPASAPPDAVPPAPPAPPPPGVPPPASPQPPAVADTTPIGPMPKIVPPPDQELDAKTVRQTCTNYTKSQGLKDEALGKGISECIAKLRPDLAGKP